MAHRRHLAGCIALPDLGGEHRQWITASPTGVLPRCVNKSALYGALIGALIGVGIVNALGDGLDGVFKLLSIVMLVWALVKTYDKRRRPKNADETRKTGKRVRFITSR